MHIPVLLQEVLDALSPLPGEFHIDGTLGGGGHTREIIKRLAPSGTFLGIDRDRRAVEKFKSSADFQLLKNSHAVASSYANVAAVVQNQYLGRADGLLLDLGFSSEQISGEFSGRGFSFLADEELLMTYDENEEPLYSQLAKLSESEIFQILRDYGEERYAKGIAASINNQRGQIKRTTDLVSAVLAGVPESYQRGKLHPATKTFQAFRVFINQELEQLKQLLDSLDSVMKVGGRVVIISFHSLEDRIVKEYFKSKSQKTAKNKYAKGLEEKNGFQVKILYKKPITASVEEIKNNPRARSAKLRAIQILSLWHLNDKKDLRPN